MNKCEECGERTYIIYINKEHEKLCDKCYDKRKGCKYNGLKKKIL